MHFTSQDSATSTATGMGSEIQNAATTSAVSTDLQHYQFYRQTNRFISISFETLDEYTERLQFISQQIHHFSYGSRSLIFLAAAVSDFYLPLDKVSK